MKTCTKCHEDKPLTGFYLRKDGRTYQSECKRCHIKAMTKRRKRRLELEPDYRLKTHLKSKFGLGLEEYRAMFKSQLGRCAICERAISEAGKAKGMSNLSAHVDHDHSTGELRALLCHECNLALGLFHDDPRVLEKAARYVKINQRGEL